MQWNRGSVHNHRTVVPCISEGGDGCKGQVRLDFRPSPLTCRLRLSNSFYTARTPDTVRDPGPGGSVAAIQFSVEPGIMLRLRAAQKLCRLPVHACRSRFMGTEPGLAPPSVQDGWDTAQGQTFRSRRATAKWMMVDTRFCVVHTRRPINQ